MQYQAEILRKFGVLELLVKDERAGRGTGYEHDGGFRRVSNGIGPDLCSIFGRNKLTVHDSEQKVQCEWEVEVKGLKVFAVMTEVYIRYGSGSWEGKTERKNEDLCCNEHDIRRSRA